MKATCHVIILAMLVIQFLVWIYRDVTERSLAALIASVVICLTAFSILSHAGAFSELHLVLLP